MAESRGGRGNAVLTGFRLHLVPSGRSAPGAGIQACCGIHGCLGHRLGSHVQWARSVRGLDGSPTALAYQLPRAAGSTPGLEPPQRAPSRQGRSGPYGQHCDRCAYQPARQFTLPSQRKLVKRLHPQAVQLIWSWFGVAQVDLFASPETTHCQWFYSLTEATLGTDALAHSWPRGLRKYAFPQWAY